MVEEKTPHHFALSQYRCMWLARMEFIACSGIQSDIGNGGF